MPSTMEMDADRWELNGTRGGARFGNDARQMPVLLLRRGSSSASLSQFVEQSPARVKVDCLPGCLPA